MSDFKTNVMRILEKEKVRYTAHEYPHGKEAVDGVTVASLLGQDPARVFKTLETRGDSGGYFVFVIPIAEELDLKKAARSVGEKSVEMIHVKDINAVTGYVRGGCTSVGMKKQYPVRVDESASGLETMVVSGGKIGVQIELQPQDLLKAAGGEYADLLAR
jgi:Cys-tRNA(Pro)/Cys-tRNA(Cys) deacylase